MPGSAGGADPRLAASAKQKIDVRETHCEVRQHHVSVFNWLEIEYSIYVAFLSLNRYPGSYIFLSSSSHFITACLLNTSAVFIQDIPDDLLSFSEFPYSLEA